ncbi:class I adenylate-forming enzyme family protein [Bradyrhizobium sp. RDT10]
MLMTELIRRGAQYHGPRTAVMFGNEQLTFTEVDRLSNRIANFFANRAEFEVGSRVGLLLNNSLFTIPIDFACAKARISRVPLNTRLSRAEQVQMLTDADVETLIFGADLLEPAQELRERLPGLELICVGSHPVGPDLIQLSESESEEHPQLIPEPDDVVLVIYTSGTTGRLKAVQHTQATWASIAENILLNLINVEQDDIMLHAASMIHASGTFVLPYWMRGGAAAILSGFQPADYLGAIERWKPTALNLVPTMIGMLLDHPGVENVDMRSVGSIVYGAAPMPYPTMQRALKLWGPRLTQYYGQSEVPLCISVLAKHEHVGPAAERRLSSCGRPSLEIEVRLVDEDGRDVQQGDAGEIVVRAPTTMSGYYKAEELNAETFLSGNWISHARCGSVR